MANGFIFHVDGKGPNTIEFLMEKEYAKGFAQDLLEAIDKMEKTDKHIVFLYKGKPLAQGNVLLNEIKDREKRIIVH